MNVDRNEIVLDETDLKEIFGLLTSATKHERAQVYQRGGEHFFGDEDLSEEYTLTQEKREHSLDAWRAVISFLHARGFSAVNKKGEKVDLAFVERQFT